MSSVQENKSKSQSPCADQLRPDLILASASPRRKDLLGAIGVSFEVLPADVDESLLSAESPEESVLRLALLKASVISSKCPEQFVLAADTIVVFQGQVLGKPVDALDAVRMLSMLAGNSHQVFTAYALCRAKEEFLRTRLVQTEVSFLPLSSLEIERYVASGEPLDKAGSYGAQGIGAGFIKEIRGSYTNVVGLPLAELVEDFKLAGIGGVFF